MITRTLSLVEAVDGETPMSSLNAFAILLGCSTVKIMAIVVLKYEIRIRN
jgi:hypothetical protein